MRGQEKGGVVSGERVGDAGGGGLGMAIGWMRVFMAIGWMRVFMVVESDNNNDG